MNATASEVFGVGQYADHTLCTLFEALRLNKESKVEGSWTFNRLAAVRDEMQRRGIKSKGARP